VPATPSATCQDGRGAFDVRNGASHEEQRGTVREKKGP
jgi:hypothetical protein